MALYQSVKKKADGSINTSGKENTTEKRLGLCQKPMGDFLDWTGNLSNEPVFLVLQVWLLLVSEWRVTKYFFLIDGLPSFTKYIVLSKKMQYWACISGVTSLIVTS